MPEGKTTATGVSDKKWLVALLLCILIWPLAIHRFYVGKVGTAILFILTMGGFGIWALVDLIMIVTNKFTDKQGRQLAK